MSQSDSTHCWNCPQSILSFVSLPLIEGKLRLRSLIPTQPSRWLYCDHVEERVEDLFRLACEHDLQGVSARHEYSPYRSGQGETNWIKIRKASYSQIADRVGDSQVAFG